MADIFRYSFSYENGFIFIQISQKFIPRGSINSLRPSDAYMRQ